ncbi:hypothetical protein INT47_013071 [Mucor saturninus]|uniref:Pol polyprotein n=1 Tax=Mucor saturninus TaxID=64648 RepID=A0A8H7QDG9_9FUNG|nr:hypothetical protein INT47_013071 [Mucor saturninus]
MSKKFFMQTDASLYGISAILYQKAEDGRNKHIAFISKSLNKHQWLWSTNRREIYAIIFGLERFRPLLLGNPNLEIRTDHSALIYLYSSSYLSSNLQNYVDTLNEYGRLKISYVKGVDNTLPDALSRLYPPVEEDIQQKQEEDQVIRKMLKYIMIKRQNIEHDDNTTSAVKKRGSHFTKRQIVHSKDKDLHILAVKLNNEQFKEATLDYLIPPLADRKSLVEEAHKMGHFGIEGVVQSLLSDGMYWSSMYKECKEIISNCIPCAQHTIVKRGYNPKKSIVAWDVFDHIAMDLAGPFAVTENQNLYILVVVDVATRYIIARPLPNKQSDTVAKVLTGIFGDYGIAIVGRFIQSDNGREFRNSLMQSITQILGIKHKFSTAYYPQGNGIAETSVKMITNTLRKLCGQDFRNWDDILPTAQLCCNLKIRTRSGSSPFSLMFARKVNKVGDYSNDNAESSTTKRCITEEELLQRAEKMSTVVFPAIKKRTMQLIEEYDKKFNKKHYLIDIPLGQTVMVRLPSRDTKLSPLFEGPFVVVRKTESNNYVLRDETNELLHRDYTPSELKVVNIDETAIEDEYVEVDEIRDHKGSGHSRLFLVKWKGLGERENSWIHAGEFRSPEPIRKYWKRVEEQKTKALLTNTPNVIQPIRKRGRPRKVDNQVPTTNSNAIELGTKRSRATTVTTVTQDQPTRKRGRPRKA